MIKINNKIRFYSNLLIAIFLGYFLLYALVKRGCDLNLIRVDFLFPYFDYIFWFLIGLLLGYRVSIRIVFRDLKKNGENEFNFSKKYKDVIDRTKNNN